MRGAAICFVAVVGLLLSLPQVAFSTEQEVHLTPEVDRLKNNAPKRILFVGNSYLYYNDSLHNHVRRIGEEIGPYRVDEYEYKSATIGGAALSHHAIDSLLTPGKLGIDKPFDVVILQGGSGEVLSPRRRAAFFETAADYAEKIRRTGAEVAFYMTHAYVPPHEKADPELIKIIASAYVKVGRDNSAPVIPVGLAFHLSYLRRADLPLHEHFDGTHPNMYGTYLGACVVYLSLYGGSLDDLNYDYYGEVPAEVAAYLRSIARDTMAQFREMTSADRS